MVVGKTLSLSFPPGPASPPLPPRPPHVSLCSQRQVCDAVAIPNKCPSTPPSIAGRHQSNSIFFARLDARESEEGNKKSRIIYNHLFAPARPGPAPAPISRYMQHRGAGEILRTNATHAMEKKEKYHHDTRQERKKSLKCPPIKPRNDPVSLPRVAHTGKPTIPSPPILPCARAFPCATKAAPAMLNMCREVKSNKSKRAPNPVRGGAEGLVGGGGALKAPTPGVPHDGVRWK